MYCPVCGTIYEDVFPFCPVCGQWRYSTIALLPAPRPGRKRLPYILMLGMLLVGLALFFLLPMDAVPLEAVPQEPDLSQTVPTVPEVPVEGDNPGLFQRDCFSVLDGTLYFDPNAFTAYPIVLVPSAMDGQQVTALAEGCFENLRDVTTIILPSSITAIGPRAFAGCAELRGICVPNAVTSIGAGAFSGCTSLEALYLPTGLNTLAPDTFQDCPMLTFIFFSGPYAQWEQMYPSFITPFTWVICWDGEYRPGANPS